MIMIMICIHTIRIYIHAIFHTTYIHLYNSHRSHVVAAWALTSSLITRTHNYPENMYTTIWT